MKYRIISLYTEKGKEGLNRTPKNTNHNGKVNFLKIEMSNLTINFIKLGVCFICRALPSMHKALGLIPNTKKNQTKPKKTTKKNGNKKHPNKQNKLKERQGR
jgi:hypothetical protein